MTKINSTIFDHMILFKYMNVANCYIKTHSRDRMVVGFTTACAFSAYHD